MAVSQRTKQDDLSANDIPGVEVNASLTLISHFLLDKFTTEQRRYKKPTAAPEMIYAVLMNYQNHLE